MSKPDLPPSGDVRAAILGIGGLGRTVALELASDRRVSELILLDSRGDRSKALQAIGRTAAVSAVSADVTDAAALRRVLSRVDVAVNTTLPEYNLLVMRACLEAGCGYVDTSGWHPTAGAAPQVGIGDVREQLAQDPVWRDRGLSAIVCFGSEPGITNVLARIAAERFERIDRIAIRVAATGDSKTEGYPLYSRETFLDDVLATPLVWDGGKHVEQEPASGEETFDFPPPIGPRQVYVVRHSEVLSLPMRLGKPVGHVDYKGAFSANLIRAINSLARLDLLAPDRIVKAGGGRLPFREIFLSTFPEPSTLIGPLPGTMAVVVEVVGTRPGGEPARIRAWTSIDHREANRRRGITAEPFLSAVGGATGCILVGLKQTPRPGVLVPEELPKDLVVPEIEARGVPLQISELSQRAPIPAVA